LSVGSTAASLFEKGVGEIILIVILMLILDFPKKRTMRMRMSMIGRRFHFQPRPQPASTLNNPRRKKHRSPFRRHFSECPRGKVVAKTVALRARQSRLTGAAIARWQFEG
jgi:hypothetical protein